MMELILCGMSYFPFYGIRVQSDQPRAVQALGGDGITEKITFDPPYRHYEGPKRIGGLEAKSPRSREFLTLLSEVQFRVIPKHKLMLKVINDWLRNERKFDEQVIQSFSECNFERLFVKKY